MSLRALEEGFSNQAVALIVTAYYVGYLGGSLRGGRLIARVSHRRAFAIAAAVAAACNSLMPLNTSFSAWLLFQGLIGASFGIVYVATESWLNLVATEKNRGRLMALYMFCMMLGLSAGPYFLNLYAVTGHELFSILSIILGVVGISILMNNASIPRQHEISRLSVFTLWRYAPSSILSLSLISIVLSGVYGLTALYATKMGMDTQRISIFVSMLFLGGFFFQWPLGYLSDHYDRFLVFSGVAFLSALCAFVISMSDDSWFLLIMGFFFGGLFFPLYSLCVATIYDRVEGVDILPASSCVIFIGCLGSMVGPLLMTGLMDTFGPESFFVMQAGVCALAGVLMLVRIKGISSRPLGV